MYLAELDRRKVEERVRYLELTKPPENDQLGVYLAEEAIQAVFGGNRCLGGETKVYDPVAGQLRRVDEIDGPFHVFAWDGYGLVTAKAGKPFKKDVGDLYAVTLSNGGRFVCSDTHLVLTPSGYTPLAGLQVGSLLSLAPSSSGLGLSSQPLDAQHCLSIPQGSQSNCLRDHRLCDEQPRSGVGIDQGVAPSRVDAHVHICGVLREHAGGLDNKRGDSRVYQSRLHPANSCGLHRSEVRSSDTLCRASYTPSGSASHLNQVAQLSTVESSPRQSIDGFALPGTRAYSTNPSITSYSVITSKEFVRRDVKWDFEVPYHNNYFAGGAIHHNSGKTIAIWKKVNDLATGVHPTLNKRFPVPLDIRVIAPKYEDNVRDVLLEMFRKNVRRIDLQGGSWSKAWSEKHRTLTYANGSRIRFFSLDQDVDTMGGKSAHIVWFDEHAPYKYFIENVMRLVDNNGLLFYTMTPEKGITWEKDYIVDGSLTNKQVKYWQFSSRKNPHLNQAGVAVATSMIRDKNLLEAKIEGGFVPLTGRVYENFSRVRNVLEIAKLPPSWGGELPAHWYRDFILDPHKQKPHYMCIVAWSPEQEIYLESECEFASPQGVNQLKDQIRMMCIGKNIGRFIMDESLGGNTVDNFGQASMKVQLRSITRNDDGTDNLGIPFLGTNQESDKSWQAGYLLLSSYVNPNPISGKPRFYILEPCVIAIRQFENYCWLDDVMDEKPLRERAKQIDNEAPDCVRYGAMGRPKIFGERPSAKKITRPGSRHSSITGIAR